MALRRLFNDQFYNFVSNYDWSTLLNIEDCSESFSHFHSEFLQLYDECFPVKICKHGYKTKTIWLNKSIKVKNKLYIISKQIPSSENINQYRIYKKRLQKLLNLAEKEYYHDLFEANKGNLKKSWDIIKRIINKKQS